jgi:hypothetical protein
MQALRLLTMIVAIMGGYLALSAATARATPLVAGSAARIASDNGIIAKAYHRYWHRPYRAYRPYRRFRPVYVYPRRPRVVCRIRYTPWGPRRVCVRRW